MRVIGWIGQTAARALHVLAHVLGSFGAGGITSNGPAVPPPTPPPPRDDYRP